MTDGGGAEHGARTSRNNPDCPDCGHTLWMSSGRWKCTLGHCYSYEEIGYPREMIA